MPWNDEEAAQRLAERLREMLDEDYERNTEIEVNAALSELRDCGTAEHGAESDFIVYARRWDWDASIPGDELGEMDDEDERRTYFTWLAEPPEGGWMARSAEGWEMAEEGGRIVLPRYGWESAHPRRTGKESLW